MHLNLKSRTVAIVVAATAASALMILAINKGPRSTSAASPQSSASRSTLPTQSYADVVDHVAPAVVTIHAARRVRAPQMPDFFNDPMFRQFFGGGGRSPRGNQQQQQPKETALGSGVIVNADGHIITNHHVVDGAEEISVDLTDRRHFDAKLIGSDTPSDLPVLALADSDKVRVGDICLAVGNPLGIGQTVTMGIVSAKGRRTEQGDGTFEDFLQTDASINQGNSGGALVNTQGELIGINSQILSTSGGNIGIGFAIPSNMARGVMDQLNKNGHVSRGKLGVGIQDITPELAKTFELKDSHGVLVASVDPGGPADRAGVKPEDVITQLNGVRVEDGNALRNRVASTAPGSDIAVTVVRNGHEQTLHAKLTELQEGNDAASSEGGSKEGTASGQLGVTVEPRRSGPGVVITDLAPGSPAAEAGLQPDDVILEVNHQAVKSAADVRSAAAKSSGGRPTLLLVSRDGRNIFVAIQGK
jgi:Do/DeqQ family serine protease